MMMNDDAQLINSSEKKPTQVFEPEAELDFLQLVAKSVLMGEPSLREQFVTLLLYPV